MAFTPGLKGIVAAETNLSGVDGEAGELVIAGYPLEVIAEQATNEEVIDLLWHQQLPLLSELAVLTEALKFQRNLPEPTMLLLREAANKSLSVIDALRMAVSTFGLRSDGQDQHDAHLLVADVLSRAAEAFFADSDDRTFYDLAMHVEQVALTLLAEYKPGRRLHTNVEFYTALLLRGLGLDSALFTPTFAVGRVVGWTAHAFEQRALDRIIRPESVYTGRKDGQWVPLIEREAV